ncbi:unnamed protein product [Moneuplotes crassus]|uniref:Uncharacterized protein n=1 Tax=Euplotes crassus TaxID=5936 RepID=A0AAD2CZS9_EUPCR|nr:unnamed protein product [Moneuplotes crassus]
MDANPFDQTPLLLHCNSLSSTMQNTGNRRHDPVENIMLHLPSEINRTYQSGSSSPFVAQKTLNDKEIDYTIFSPDFYPHGLFGKQVKQDTEQSNFFANLCNPEIFPKLEGGPEASNKARRRPDIQHRKMLRILRKFYNGLFLYHNDKLKNKRLTSVHSEVILDALIHLAKVYLPEVPPESMAEFLFKFLSLHSKDSCDLESEAAQQGQNAFNCTYYYRKKYFKVLFESEYFRCLVKSFISLRSTPVSSMSGLRLEWNCENHHNSSKKKLEKILSECLYKTFPALVEDCLNQTYQKCEQLEVAIEPRSDV